MVIIKEEDMNKIAPLFKGWDETLIWSCLQGYMGRAWADQFENPKSAQIITADFCFFAGVPDIELVKNIPDDYSADCILMAPGKDNWARLIEQVYNGNCRKFTRYAIKKEPDIFDRDKLQSYTKMLPRDYCIRKIDEELYHEILSESWSRDLCSQFPSYGDYENKGLGFAALHDGRVVSGASSYTVYDSGIEIEIDTRKDHRRKGLALACASRLILECLDLGLYPSWDAANKASVALSEKLGYHFEREYDTYAVTNFKH